MITFVSKSDKESVIFRHYKETGFVRRSTEKNEKVWIIFSSLSVKLCKVYDRDNVRPVCEGIFR